MPEFIWFAVIGKIVIFVLQRFPFKKLPWIGNWFKEDKFLGELFGCDLCLGVWVYSILAIFFRYNVIPYFYLPIISWILTGMATSFVVFVFSNGWKALFSTIVIRSD